MDSAEYRQTQAEGARRVVPWGPEDLPTLRAAYSDRTATLMAFFAGLAYEDQPPAGTLQAELKDLGFTHVTYFESGLVDGLALVAESPILCVVAFRGTRSMKNWETNLDFWPGKVLLARAGKKLRVHTGFYEAFTKLSDAGLAAKLQEVRGRTEGKVPIYVTGHSLGGALAGIASAMFAGDDLAACYTFGGPRVGNANFDQWVKAPIYRVINYADIVPQVPPPGIYRHAGDPRFLPRAGKASPFRFQPGPFIRTWQLLEGLWQLITTFSLLGIRDHRMIDYANKLNAIIEVRGRQRGGSGSKTNMRRIRPIAPATEQSGTE